VRQDFLHPSRPALGPTFVSHTMGTRSFLVVKELECGVNHPPPSSAKVKETVPQNLCSPSGHWWQV
jgi:hypothetical protein